MRGFSQIALSGPVIQRIISNVGCTELELGLKGLEGLSIDFGIAGLDISGSGADGPGGGEGIIKGLWNLTLLVLGRVGGGDGPFVGKCDSVLSSFTAGSLLVDIVVF